MAREKTNKGDMTISSKVSGKSMGTATKTSKKGGEAGRTGGFGGSVRDNAGDTMSNEPPEPEVLLSILHRKTRF
jgi:hypothetical protein